MSGYLDSTENFIPENVIYECLRPTGVFQWCVLEGPENFGHCLWGNIYVNTQDAYSIMSLVAVSRGRSHQIPRSEWRPGNLGLSLNQCSSVEDQSSFPSLSLVRWCGPTGSWYVNAGGGGGSVSVPSFVVPSSPYSVLSAITLLSISAWNRVLPVVGCLGFATFCFVL